MQLLKSLVCAFGLAFLAACASTPQEQVELPTTTPFDADPFARQTYLEAYKEGYLAAKAGGEITPRYRRGPFPFARDVGWRAGAGAALNAEPAKAKGTP